MSIDQLFASPWGALLIFVLRIVDVFCDTMRVLFAIRGKRGIAGALGFVQALIWIFAVGNAVRHLDSVWHILGYAAGYATGTMVGITIERAVAYGLAVVRIISRSEGASIAAALRERGYGVTALSGSGREGTVEILDSVIHRSHVDEVLRIVDRLDSQAFVTAEDPRILRGGSLATREWPVQVRPPARWRWFVGRDRTP